MLDSQYDRACEPRPDPSCLEWGRFLGWRPDNLINASFQGRQVVARYYGTAEPYVGEMLPMAFKQGSWAMWGRNVVDEPESGGTSERCCVRIFSYIYREADGEIDFYLGGDREPELVATIADPWVGSGFALSDFGEFPVWPAGGIFRRAAQFQANSCSCKKNDWCLSYLTTARNGGFLGDAITVFWISSTGVSQFSYTPTNVFISYGLMAEEVMISERPVVGTPFGNAYDKNNNVINTSPDVSNGGTGGDFLSAYGIDHISGIPPNAMSVLFAGQSFFGGWEKNQSLLTDGKGSELTLVTHKSGSWGIPGVDEVEHSFYVYNGTPVSLYTNGHNPFGNSGTFVNVPVDSSPPIVRLQSARLNLNGGRLYYYGTDGIVYCMQLRANPDKPGQGVSLSGDGTTGVNGVNFLDEPDPEWDIWCKPWTQKRKCKPVRPEYIPPGTQILYKAVQTGLTF